MNSSMKEIYALRPGNEGAIKMSVINRTTEQFDKQMLFFRCHPFTLYISNVLIPLIER
jgi:hypothetical protein